ncbi:MAG: hypothetical protein Q9N67_04495 [Ghiorsea sp.]|nr:hypothetical protein [Ghiorsea sp.]
MKYWINITKLTWLEVVQGRVFQILLASTLLAPLFGAVLSSLFMMDIGKVYMDGVMAFVHFISMAFILFIAASLLARDIEQKVCYLLVVQPASREAYWIGRFFGFVLAYVLLVSLLVIESVLLGEFIFSAKAAVYLAGYSWLNMSLLIFLHSFQYISLLALVFFIVSWATGLAEIIFFSTMGLILSWVFPQLLLVMGQSQGVEGAPVLLYQIFEWIYQLLPHLNGANIALLLTHGDERLTVADMSLYIMEHVGYAGVFLGLGIWLFRQRDL